jgi:hypothetical protein
MNTIETAARQYANRPPDERFPSLDAILSARSLPRADEAPERAETGADIMDSRRLGFLTVVYLAVCAGVVVAWMYAALVGR